eukprot:m.55869 g.55869  ORF g.55869 m.55869 type:complete len:223 (-) comp11153_c0_seq4:239-907(-)
MSVVVVLSWFATVTTIGLFLTGIPVTRRIRKAKSSADVAFIPYLAAIANTCLWLKYGAITHDYTILLVNGVGLLLNTYYFAICFIYTKQSKLFLTPSIVTCVCVFAPLVYVWFSLSRGLIGFVEAVHIIGFCGCVGTIVMFGSPLATMMKVMKTKSTESMVFSLCLMNFVVSVTWTLYGYVIGDMFVQVRLVLFLVVLLLLQPTQGQIWTKLIVNLSAYVYV